MNDETERIYKELLKQYANAFKRAGDDGRIKVIGNAYENPELIEKKEV